MRLQRLRALLEFYPSLPLVAFHPRISLPAHSSLAPLLSFHSWRWGDAGSMSVLSAVPRFVFLSSMEKPFAWSLSESTCTLRSRDTTVSIRRLVS